MSKPKPFALSALFAGLFVAVMLPMSAGVGLPGASMDGVSDEAGIYGMATITKYGADGEPVSTQTVHNQLLDAGETRILEAVFHDGTTNINDEAQIGAICVTSSSTVTESLNATAFNTANTLSATNCKQVAEVGISNSVATLGPETFRAGTHLASSQTIGGIGICSNVQANNSDHNNCTGILFAAVDTTDVTLATGETVDITYKFNLSSSSS